MVGKYRHEMKYSISSRDYLILRPRIQALMQRDPHTDEHGLYRIHSIYFDNYTDRALRAKVNGEQRREKYRIRWYNDSRMVLTLEKKMKVNDLCMKFGVGISEEEFQKILNRDYGWMLTDDRELLREFYCRLRQQRLEPCVQVSYTREPYIYPFGNVRVTFDSEVRTSLARHDFRYVSPFVPAADEIILEVKFDEYLPAVIAGALQLGNIRQNAFSKYMVCRRYG